MDLEMQSKSELAFCFERESERSNIFSKIFYQLKNRNQECNRTVICNILFLNGIIFYPLDLEIIKNLKRISLNRPMDVDMCREYMSSRPKWLKEPSRNNLHQE